METIKNIDVKNKTVLVRVDYNVPMSRNPETGEMEIESDLRIRASLPTLRCLLDNGAEKVILISHLGRPEGKVVPEFSLRPVMIYLRQLLEAEGLDAARVELLENLRFDSREEENSREYAEEIIAATGAEVFVQDGFAVCHRAHTSTSAIVDAMKEQGKPCVAGLLLEKEVDGLSRVMREPERPFIVIMGGAKVADKAPLIEKFQKQADEVLVGGKIALEYESAAENIYIAEDFDEDGDGDSLDIGPVATGNFIKSLEGARTVLWNGVLGKAEDPAFATGSEIVAKYLGERPEIFSVICGGDTTGFVEGLMEKEPGLRYGLVSTGGGAALEFLAGEELPGIKCLQNN